MILAFDIQKRYIEHPEIFSKELFQKGMQAGVLIRPIGQTVYVMPPYILSDAEIEFMGKSIHRALGPCLRLTAK
jgi:adenosylmethionine-8-amino-7-oxononanoate aminotransferase